jgi:hypothetical protein
MVSDAELEARAATDVDDEVPASFDGSPSDANGGLDTYSIIASIRGTACLDCAEDPNIGCAAPGLDCESLSEIADGGAAAGASRRQLCYDTLRCLLTSGCLIVRPDAAADPMNGYACYCGEVPFRTCESAPEEGACRAAEERGLETTAAGTVLARFVDSDFGAGVANALGTCLVDFCRSSCFP